MSIMQRLSQSGVWTVRRGLRAAGLDMVAFGPTSPDWQLYDAIRRRSISTTLDVGGNRGQFASQLRTRGFAGTIHSFEPLAAPFADLQAMASRDPGHHAHQLAFSEAAGSAEIFVGANDQTSSLQRPSHADAQSGLARAHEVAGTERIRTERLDAWCRDNGVDVARTFLKLDVQGHEMSVLKGAGDLLDDFPLLQLELSILPLYEGETGFGAFLDFLQGRGFGIRAIRPNYFDPDTGALSQVDVIAERR